MAPFGLIELKDGNILVFGGEDKAEERKLGDTVLEKKMPKFIIQRQVYLK